MDAMVGPIYTKIYTLCNKNDKGSFSVHGPDFSGETDGFDTHMHEISFQDALNNNDIIYCVVEHDLEYPYSKYDFEEIILPENDLQFEIFKKHSEPRMFAEATIVATPKMALI